MATNTWIASSAGVWNNSVNWSLEHVPTSGEDVLFNGTGTGKCTLDIDTAPLGSFTITSANAADFDDGGFIITTSGTFDVLISNLVTITMTGKVIVTGDANFTINGSEAGDYSDGYFVGAPEIDFRGSGAVSLMWYAYVADAYDATNSKKLTIAYPGKVAEMILYGNLYGLVTKGGTINMTTGGVIQLYLVDSNFVFDIDPDTVWANSGEYTPMMFVSYRNPSAAVFNFSGIDLPTLKVYISFAYVDMIPSYGDIILNINGDWNVAEITASDADLGWPVGSNVTYNINGTFNIGSIRFGNNSATYRIKWYFGDSVLNIANFVNTHQVSTDYGAGRLQLYLENSVWTVLGQVAYGSDNSIWFVGPINTDLFPGTSTVILQPAAIRDLRQGYSQTTVGGYYAFYNLYIQAGTGYIDYINVPFLIENEFRWGNSGSSIWRDPANTGLELRGATPKIKLDSDFHGGLRTRVPGQVVTWETLNGASYILDSSAVGDINGSTTSIVEWKSATPATTYKIDATVSVTMGAIKLTDCNNVGTNMKVSRATFVDGGNNTGIAVLSSSSFAAPTVSDDVSVVSTIDKDILVSLIQQQIADTYFDTPEEIMQVVVYYTHSDGRQFQYAVFEGNPLTGQFLWGAGARDGVWNKNKVVVYDWNNAKTTLFNISLESVVHASGAMTLNVT